MLLIGIDLGKSSHYAGFISPALLKTHRFFDKCPAISFANTRAGFEKLLTELSKYGTRTQCAVLLERTGHYGNVLIDYLLERGIAVYSIYVQKRVTGIRKTDKYDALNLANTLYCQLALEIQVADKQQRIRRVIPASETAQRLTNIRHRYEMVQRQTAVRNKLTAICDELFPEFTEIFKDPNKHGALNVRERFPLPADVAGADLDTLIACREHTKPGLLEFVKLQELAAHSIGTKREARQYSLCREQAMLIKELRSIEANLAVFDAEIAQIVQESREGQILLSLPMLNHVGAAMIIAAIGTIGNFEKASELKAYFGWSPRVSQSGSELDSVALSRRGNRAMKQMMYLIALTAIHMDTEWRALYQRLVPRLCRYDGRRDRYIGKNKCVGHIAGRIIRLIYTLLRHDYEVLQALKPGEEPPPPTLYDRALHHVHRC